MYFAIRRRVHPITLSLCAVLASSLVSADTKSSEKSSPTQQQETTPAQKLYGLPKNPIIGGQVDMDLKKPLNLDRAIKIGLLRQNSIAISKASTDAANARLVQSRSSYYPTVEPTFSYSSNVSPGGSINIGGQIIRGSRQSETRTEAIAARFTIYDSGRREANVGASRRNLFGTEYGLANQRQAVVLDVTESFYSLLRDRELVRVQEESVKRAQTTLDAIKAQVEAGTAAKSDTLQAESDLANARVSLYNAQNNARLTEASLKNAMGVVAENSLNLEDSIPQPSIAPDPVKLEKYVQAAYDNRYDLRQQQERINATGYSVRLAHINAGITLDASISEGFQIHPDTGEQRTFRVDVSYPLFDGGNSKAAVKEAKAQLEQDRRQLDLLQQNIRLSVDQSYSTREQAKRRLEAARLAVEAGKLNYQAALEKQKNGLVNILEVINAEVQLVNAEVSAVQAVYDYYIADARLQREIGVNDPTYLPKVPGVKQPVRPRQ